MQSTGTDEEIFGGRSKTCFTRFVHTSISILCAYTPKTVCTGQKYRKRSEFISDLKQFWLYRGGIGWFHPVIQCVSGLCSFVFILSWFKYIIFYIDRMRWLFVSTRTSVHPLMSSIFSPESPKVPSIRTPGGSACGGEGEKQRGLHRALGRLHHLSIVQSCCLLLCARSYACPQSRLNETHHGILLLSEREREVASMWGLSHTMTFF